MKMHIGVRCAYIVSKDFITAPGQTFQIFKWESCGGGVAEWFKAQCCKPCEVFCPWFKPYRRNHFTTSQQ